MAKNIQHLQGLMSRRPVDRKAGTTSGRILEHLIYGQNQMPETQIKIEIIRETLEDFARKQQEGAKFRKKNYKRKTNEIKDAVGDFRIMYKSILPLKRTGDIEDGEFSNFAPISNKIEKVGEKKLAV